jgi:pyruvate formate-lyase activating enzyme-like uncharacterized protein
VFPRQLRSGRVEVQDGAGRTQHLMTADSAHLAYLNATANRVAEEHAQHSAPVNWLSPYRASEFEETRNAHIAGAGAALAWDFQGTKPWVHSLSPGCRLCGEGQWSCLFITGLCNARCFYCPASQERDEIPQTQRLLFEDPEAYARYINWFGFKGVAFSGGEPLMVFDRAVRAIETVRRLCPPDVYVWMYTNGILGSEAKFKRLARAGIDEIRFDLGATNYRLAVLQGAAEFIRNVTVEIPAVPEEVERLKELLPRLCELGVTRLNLHQLRLTSYNAEKLLPHGYTYLHGEQPTVLESELAAFELMAFVVKQGLPLGVNYCNFQFKNRFQKAGFRRKMATRLAAENEQITGNGFLRRIIVETAGVASDLALEALASLSELPERIVLHYEGRVLTNLGGQASTRHHTIEGVDYPIDDGLTVAPILLRGGLVADYLEMMSHDGSDIPSRQLLFQAWQREFIETGMRDYF